MFRYIFSLAFILNFTSLLACEQIKDQDHRPLQAGRLVSDTDHIQFLKNVLCTAKSDVMITSYQVQSKRLFDDGIGQAIIDAAERGVKVYIYYEHRPYFAKDDYADLKLVSNSCAKFEENANHSKCVIKDKEIVAIGSYNWLCNSWGDSYNASLVFSGGVTPGIIEEVWQGIRFYQSLKYGNFNGKQSFANDNKSFLPGEYQFLPGQFLYTLRIPEAHHSFLNEVFEKATQNIKLYSPFIRLDKLRKTVTPQLLQNLEQRGVCFTLISLPSPCDKVPEEENNIFALLSELTSNYINFSYLTQNVHAKSLDMDNDVACEGSFNWLSAVDKTDHSANNFEMSIAIKGSFVSNITEGFVQPKVNEFTVKSADNLFSINSNMKICDEPKSFQTNQNNNFNNNSAIEILSGDRIGRAGFCVRFNGKDYIKNSNGTIRYFKNQQEAQQAAHREAQYFY